MNIMAKYAYRFSFIGWAIITLTFIKQTQMDSYKDVFQFIFLTLMLTCLSFDTFKRKEEEDE